MRSEIAGAILAVLMVVDGILFGPSSLRGLLNKVTGSSRQAAAVWSAYTRIVRLRSGHPPVSDLSCPIPESWTSAEPVRDKVKIK